MYKTVDANTKAAEMIISDIERPTYVMTDLFKTMVNSTFNQAKPLDFRLYPGLGNSLPLTLGYPST